MENSEHLFLTSILQECYPQLTPLTFDLLGRSLDTQGQPISLLFRIARLDGPDCVLQAYHDNYASSRYFSWVSTQSLHTWLQQRASLLLYLDQQGYHCPVPMPTTTGEYVCERQQWHLLLSPFLVGRGYDGSLEHAHLLGAALGRLHQVAPSTALPPSWWEQGTTIRPGLHRLQSVEVHIAPSYRNLYEQCVSDFETFAGAGGLHIGIIHGDCWGPNFLRVKSEVGVLIDWEFAGLGMSILDLGALLLMGQCSADGNFPSAVDGECVKALL